MTDRSLYWDASLFFCLFFIISMKGELWTRYEDAFWLHHLYGWKTHIVEFFEKSFQGQRKPSMQLNLFLLTQRSQKILEIFRRLHFPFSWEVCGFALHLETSSWWFLQKRSPCLSSTVNQDRVCEVWLHLRVISLADSSPGPDAAANRKWWQGGTLLQPPPLSTRCNMWIRDEKCTSSKSFDIVERQAIRILRLMVLSWMFPSVSEMKKRVSHVHNIVNFLFFFK